MTTLGDNIREARRERQFSLAQLAVASGLTKGFLSQVESGRSNPSLASLERIAAGLGVSALQLMASDPGTIPNPLVPSSPRIIRAESSFGNEGIIEVVNATEAGTHFLVVLTSSYELIAERASDSGSVLVTILEGSIEVSQVVGGLKLEHGEVGTWNGSDAYTISVARHSTARILLFVPRVLAVPSLRLTQTRVFSPSSISSTRPSLSAHSTSSRSVAASSDGSMRLVAMRAQRLAERKRTP